ALPKREHTSLPLPCTRRATRHSWDVVSVLFHGARDVNEPGFALPEGRMGLVNRPLLNGPGSLFPQHPRALGGCGTGEEEQGRERGDQYTTKRGQHRSLLRSGRAHRRRLWNRLARGDSNEIQLANPATTHRVAKNTSQSTTSDPSAMRRKTACAHHQANRVDAPGR